MNSVQPQSFVHNNPFPFLSILVFFRIPHDLVTPIGGKSVVMPVVSGEVLATIGLVILLEEVGGEGCKVAVVAMSRLLIINRNTTGSYPVSPRYILLWFT